MNDIYRDNEDDALGILPRDRAREKVGAGATSGDRNFVKALARGLIVLEAFSASDEVWLDVAEVAARVGLPHPTVMRFLRSLVSLGHLQYSQNRRQYRLGVGVLALGYAAREPFSFGELVRPYLKILADTYNVHAALAKRDRLDALEVEVSHSLKTLMTLQLEVGSRLPLAGTATGMGLIVSLPQAEIDYLMVNLEQRHKRNWPRLKAGIDSAREEYAEKGYLTAQGSWDTDINGVAVPLVFPGGSPVFSLTCGAPALHLPPDKQRIIGERLLLVRQVIEEKLRKGDVNSGARAPR
ncbi:IclR family transcriptional regulator [Sulfitobacter dubius]|uniref:HTH-type transcriptional regulator TsaQ1/TsaQ2 n=1 Tax=Sulfitobacter dubius TaxID=218673 RepID=A0ABY3ZRH4_9RHOB|nr:helix-turn-helix domain-containing protein [Sulfitobacter dubius]UOA17206.1 HTH-type transcriptional regulator TsaQ1/TsaQ2 [Sulfitobacter dubius]